MFWTDYRVILRRFEYERLLVNPRDDRDDFGRLYSNRLLDEFFLTDASKLDRTIRRLNETQRTLYAVNALCGQIANGGISQFLFNAKPVLRDATAIGLEHIGATEVLHRYREVAARLKGTEDLVEIRASAEEWDDYLTYKEELEGEPSVVAAFDDWYFNGQATVLDRLMRAYIAGREGDLVRFCDGNARLETRWFGKRLGQWSTISTDTRTLMGRAA